MEAMNMTTVATIMKNEKKSMHKYYEITEAAIHALVG